LVVEVEQNKRRRNPIVQKKIHQQKKADYDSRHWARRRVGGREAKMRKKLGTRFPAVRVLHLPLRPIPDLLRPWSDLVVLSADLGSRPVDLAVDSRSVFLLPGVCFIAEAPSGRRHARTGWCSSRACVRARLIAFFPRCGEFVCHGGWEWEVVWGVV
jgi:hypothetical protein